MYESKRDKVIRYVNDFVIPSIQKKDLDYNLLVSDLCGQFGVSKEVVNEIFQMFMRSGKIKEVRVLTLPDNLVIDWLKKDRELKQDIKKDINNLDKMEVEENI